MRSGKAFEKWNRQCKHPNPDSRMGGVSFDRALRKAWEAGRRYERMRAEEEYANAFENLIFERMYKGEFVRVDLDEL